MKEYVSIIAIALGTLGFGTTAFAQPANPDFGAGLDGWTVNEAGGSGSPGTVEAVAEGARLLEGDSFKVSLRQTFAVTGAPSTLSFAVSLDPGFDLGESFIPDAFEVSLLDGSGVPLAEQWKPGASSFFNLQEDGTAHLGGTTTWDGSNVTVDLSSAPAGLADITLVFAMIGGDGDTGSGVTIGDVIISIDNLPPTADATVVGGLTVECAGDPTTITLDATGSSDPDGDTLSFEWFDDDDNSIGTTGTVTTDVGLDGGMFRVVVDDGRGLTDEAAITVVVDDTTGPTVDVSGAETEVTVDPGTCIGSLPDYTQTVSATDACQGTEGLTVTQSPPAGTNGSPDESATVTITATDSDGNSTQTMLTPMFVDPTGQCGMTGDEAEDAGELDPDVGGGGDTADETPNVRANTDDDCDCSVSGQPTLPRHWLALLLGGALLAARRRRATARGSD